MSKGSIEIPNASPEIVAEINKNYSSLRLYDAFVDGNKLIVQSDGIERVTGFLDHKGIKYREIAEQTRHAKGDGLMTPEEEEKARQAEQKPVTEGNPAPATPAEVPGKLAEAPTPEAPAAPPAEENDVKQQIDALSRGLEEMGSRIARIEEVLDSLSEEEATEAPKEGALAEQPPEAPPEKNEGVMAREGEGAPPKKDEEEEEKEAKHAKDKVAVLEKEVVELKAQFSRLSNAGARKTMPSTTPKAKTVEEEMAPIWAAFNIN